MSDISIQPIAPPTAERRPDILDILATAQFWRLRIVEFGLLAAIVFWLGFAIAGLL